MEAVADKLRSEIEALKQQKSLFGR